MIIYDLMKAVQDDARRVGERDRLLLEARRARRAHRQRLVPAAPARRRTEMGKIVVSENVTLDGFTQDPAGDDGFRAGGRVGLIGNSPQLAKLALGKALAAGAFLLGRRSYEWLAARWPSRSGELADRLNSLPKYIVSATLANPAWNNSTVLKGDVLNEVSTLKQHIEGDIVIAGSFQPVRTLIEHDLAGELRLKISPVALGVGERLSGETSDKKPIRLLDTQTLEGSIAYLTLPGARTAFLSCSWRLVGDPSRPFGDRAEIAGLDQFVRLEPGEGARPGDRQAQGSRSLGVRQFEDDQAVVLPEHPVVGLHAATGRLHQSPDHSCPVRGLGNKTLGGLPREAEQDYILSHRYPPSGRADRP